MTFKKKKEVLANVHWIMKTSLKELITLKQMEQREALVTEVYNETITQLEQKGIL
jgi:hypothetical protein